MSDQRRDRLTQPFIEIANGHQLFVRDWGSGRPVVLLAGWGMDSRIWAEVMVALNAVGLRTIAYDRRGHGRSTDPGYLDYDMLADDLARVLESLDLREVTLVCHSGAGGEAIRYASRHGPNRLTRIVLVGATGPRVLPAEDPAGAHRAAAQVLIDQLGSNMATWISGALRPFAPQADGRLLDWAAHMVFDCSRRALVDFQRAVVEADFEKEAAALTVPVTIVHGDQDESAPLQTTAVRYASLIKRNNLLVYEGVAHGIMLTHASRLAADIAADAAS